MCTCKLDLWTCMKSGWAIQQYILMKKLESDKNESFNIIKSREKESIAKKLKKTKNVHGKPLRRDGKPWVSKGECPLLFQTLYYVKNGTFPCTMIVFFLPHLFTYFLLFSLMFSHSSCPNGLATCSSYSSRNVAKYKRQVFVRDCKSASKKRRFLGALKDTSLFG